MQQEVAKSLDAQLDDCLTHIRTKKYRHSQSDVYRDLISGARRDRKGYYQLLARIEKGDVHVIVAWNLSRAGRNTLDSAWLAAKCKEFGVRIELAAGGEYSFDDPHDKLIYDILCSIAEFERNAILQTLMRGKKAGARRGQWVNGEPPFGYRITGPRGAKKLEPEPGEAAWVPRIYERYLAGMGVRDMAAWLAKEAPAPRQGGLKARTWNHMRVRRILGNPVYAGWLTFQDRSVRGQHDALIAQAAYDRVQERLVERRVRHPGRPRAGIRPSR